MKQGTTPTLEFKLDIEISNVTEVIFTFTDELAYKGTSEDDTPSYLLQKNYPEDATFEDDTFKLPLTQEETDLLTNTFFVEAQVICDKAVVKSDIKKVNMPHTLWTTYVDDNESDGQSEVIHLSFSDNVIVEGGSTSNYNDLTNKPRINNIELIGNKTDTDLGLATKTELNAKQNVISGGNGIDVSSDVVSVDLRDNDTLGFNNQGELMIRHTILGNNDLVRQALVDTHYLYPLASKTYVDNLMSGAVKRLVVESLPTQNIDTNTIYMILKSVPTTNNIYDEYMYINNAWELIGSTEVDLSNYYTKTESDNKYQNKLTVGNGIDITSDVISVLLQNSTDNALSFSYDNKLTLSKYNLGHDSDFRQNLTSDSYQNPLQPKLTAGTNITIDANNVISASGLSYTFTDGLAESSGTVGIDLKSGTELQITNDQLDIDLSSYVKNTDYATSTVGGTIVGNATAKFNINSSGKPSATTTTYSDYQSGIDGMFIGKGTLENVITGKQLVNQTDLSSKQDTIDSSHKLSADNVDDTNSTNKFVTSTEKSTWNGKADNTTISTDTSSTTVSLTLADNHEYRYTQDLTSLTLTMPSGDFIASVVFASGSTPTSMTYDSSIKWSGDDVTNGQFVPTEKTYNIVMWYDGINVNGVVRGVA